MKRNAIARIVIYSVLILLFSGILLTALGIDAFTFRTDSGSYEENYTEETFSVSGISNLDIDWVAGSITILAADTDVITVSESGEFSQKYKMRCDVSDNTLSINYTKSTVFVGIGSHPEKNLLITVPREWFCSELEIDAAAVEVTVDDVQLRDIELDGAGMVFNILGSFQTLSCDGAGCKLNLTTTYAASQIELDGAGCKLQLMLPQNCGFQVQLDGLGCDFSSNISTHREDGCIVYGDRSCHVDVNGIGCHIVIQYADAVPAMYFTE